MISPLPRGRLFALFLRALCDHVTEMCIRDRTGTITLGNRQAAEFIPVDGVDPAELADAAQLLSLIHIYS